MTSGLLREARRKSGQAHRLVRPWPPSVPLAEAGDRSTASHRSEDDGHEHVERRTRIAPGRASSHRLAAPDSSPTAPARGTALPTGAVPVNQFQKKGRVAVKHAHPVRLR
jgi:hypothetical protein